MLSGCCHHLTLLGFDFTLDPRLDVGLEAQETWTLEPGMLANPLHIGLVGLPDVQENLALVLPLVEDLKSSVAEIRNAGWTSQWTLLQTRTLQT